MARAQPLHPFQNHEVDMLRHINAANGKLMLVTGRKTTVEAADTIVTGLASVTACGASLDSDPVLDPMLASATIGDQAGTPAAGSIIVKTWKGTSTSNPTPIAATVFSRIVNWWAIGVQVGEIDDPAG